MGAGNRRSMSNPCSSPRALQELERYGSSARIFPPGLFRMNPACPSHQIGIRPGGVRGSLTCSNKRAFKATSRSFRENSEPSSLVKLMILDVRSQFLNGDVELTLPQRVDDAL